MTVMPRSVKDARINDLKNMILPEMVPDQLKLLGVTLEDLYPDNFADAQASAVSGLEVLKLIERRTNLLQRKTDGLYATKTQMIPTQLDWIIENTTQLMKACSSLPQLAPPAQPENEPFYRLLDQAIERAIYIGYYAGSNDTLALTDRYTNSGFEASVTRTQAGGKGKAQKTISLKQLVIDMANFIYCDPDCIAAPKKIIAEAIHLIIRNFSKKGNNKEIPSLLKFSDRHPEQHTIDSWLKTVIKPVNRLKKTRPSLAVIKAKLTASFTDKKIAAKIK
ncbi:hypothetical protein L9G16_15035 [Shewanella sp. A25]|nr:hypothetical protein [Shewanella shenzhenensis]